ncbi:hypothetical protein P869_10240 [Ligilactobacillus ruminis S23]|nr:hypothetical protein P869_10240 [Ligilactobacillus ruminis S23]
MIQMSKKVNKGQSDFATFFAFKISKIVSKKI